MTHKKLFLHVGFVKTETSFVQQTLSRNRKLLQEQGVYYPEIVRPSSQESVNHGEMLASLFSERPEALYENIKRGADIGVVNAAYREQFEKLLAREDGTVIVSAEGMDIARREFYEKIGDILQRYDWSIEVIAALRSPLSALTGNYSERVRGGLVSSDTPHYRLLVAILRRLEILRSVFDTVRTYPFSEACRHTCGPVGYFLDFLGIENAGAFEIVTADEGLSNNAVRLLAYVNRFEPIILNGKKNPRRSCGDLKALWSIPGPDFRLTLEEYETIRERIEFENGRLENDLGREYCDDTMKLRLSDVHWDEESLRVVRGALPEVPDVLVPYVHRYFEEERGIVLTQDAAGPELPECRPAPERPEAVVRSVEERLRAGQLDDVSAIALLRSAIGGDEGDRLLYDRACELLLESGKSQEAADLAEDGLTRFDGDLALMSRLGYAYAAEGEAKRALDQWARVRQVHPSAEAGWIEGAMCGASLGFDSEAGELLGAYLAQLEDRLSRPWWDRVLRVTEAILLGCSEGRHVRGLLEALFLRPVAPDLAAYFEIFTLLFKLTVLKRRPTKSGWTDSRESKKLLDLLKDIHQSSLIGCDDDQAVALELALGINAELDSSDRIREFVIGLSFQNFCRVFSIRCLDEVHPDFFFERNDIHKIVATLPVTDPDNARKCLIMRYALGMDYGAAYEALTGSLLPTAREGYSDFAFAAYAGNGRPKVAFCISGQLRGYREAFASWRKSRLFADCDVSVFVHTWPEVGAVSLSSNKAFRVFSGNFLQAFIKEWNEGIDKFKNTYSNLFQAVANSRVVSAAELAEFYETPYVVVESEKNYHDYTNTEKMFYKIHACWELACASGEEFHFAFRIRPDFELRDDSRVDWHEIIVQSKNDRMACVRHLKLHRTGPAVNDQIGFGNPAVMAVYSNTWNRMQNPNGLIRGYQDPHVFIALNLIEHEVRFAPFPKKFIAGALLSVEKPSLESLRGALEKDLISDQRCDNPLWLALEEDISCEVKQEKHKDG